MLDINRFDVLYEAIKTLKYDALGLDDPLTGSVIYRTLQMMEELLISMPKNGTRKGEPVNLDD